MKIKGTAMRPATAARPAAPPRGVTLVEMLVVVALLVLVMTILVAIFRSATGAISVSRTFTQMDQQLRRLDATLREDLEGVTARFTPPLDPKNNLGYFEYGENALSDIQEEDTDDYLAFTAKAPPGRPFTGRIWLPNGYQLPVGAPGPPPGVQPITVTSDFAEIIYFLRNGNLYRRVLLIMPERHNGLAIGRAPQNPPLNIGGPTNRPMNPGGGFYTFQFDGIAHLVSWQGLNDISARPSPYIPASMNSASVDTQVSSYIPLPNTLGDLTNRHNRFARPRFANDYRDNATGALIPDGVVDDENIDLTSGAAVGNGIPDYYPTLYPLATAQVPFFADGRQLLPENDNSDPLFVKAGSYDPISPSAPRLATFDTMPFPYVFRGAYSVGDRAAITDSVHGMAPQGSIVNTAPAAPASPPYRPNHAPLSSGDNLAIPTAANQFQTWWGFPTRRETTSRFWTDPIKRVNDPATTAVGGTPPYQTPQGDSDGTDPNQGTSLHPNDQVHSQAPGLSWQPALLTPLPKMDGTVVPLDNQLFNDGAGTALTAPGFVPIPINPEAVYQDDLIMTGVRSFNVKAYDDYAASQGFDAYQDLGWGDLDNFGRGPSYAEKLTFAHEGRMPPLPSDNVFDSKYPTHTNVKTGAPVFRNLGDSRAGIVRMRRVYDTWSTDYSSAPDVPLIPGQGPPSNPPVYPSYPAPYPIPLRGIQIQIRVTDPKNERTKTVTIRQDFTDKL
jgi:prepilin-type N-terminal cleavage/methylation domain-containing protein